MQAIRDALKKALNGHGIEAEPTLELTNDFSHGDLTSNVAMRHAKELGANPRALAGKLVAEMGTIDGVEKIDISGPGFINFTLAPSAVRSVLGAAGDMWGQGTGYRGKKILVEYTDPNPFKEFHIGHLVPNALGESLSRLYQFGGAEVKRANYQGDVGIHVAKSLFIQLEKGITDPTIADLASAYPEGSRRYDEDPAAKDAIDALNKKINDKSDERVNALYEKGRAVSLTEFERLYAILGTKFDFYFFESATGPKGVEVVRAHPEIFVESDGAIVFKGEEHGLHTRVFINKLGLPTYEAKEIGLARMKAESYPFDLTLTVTGNEQAEYFKVVMKAMELAIPELSGRLAFKTNGMLRFAEGKMSSRTGNVITGASLLADLMDAAREHAENSRAENKELLAQQVAVAAIKFQILRSAMGKDMIFDRERALSLEGDSGPYLQYAHARAHTILEKAKEGGVAMHFSEHESLSDIERHLYRFPAIVARAAAELEPHLVVTYLIELAGHFNSWYAREQILDGTEKAAHKVAITVMVARTLKNGLWILGIPAPEKM
jgi:arginyl-tRNA synthetase